MSTCTPAMVVFWELRNMAFKGEPVCSIRHRSVEINGVLVVILDNTPIHAEIGYQDTTLNRQVVV